MGEKAVLLGEDGQTIVRNLCLMLGWHIGEHYDVNCTDKSHTTGPERSRGTHGIDGLYHQHSVLNHNLEFSCCVSSKHSMAEGEGPSFTTIKTDFKDSVEALKCYVRSADYKNAPLTKVRKQRAAVGLIFAINTGAGEHFSLAKRSKDLPHPRGVYDYIQVVDTERAKFLYSTMQDARSADDNDSFRFLYISTGLNQEGDKLYSEGVALPLEYLYSEIIPVAITLSQKNELRLYTKDTPKASTYLRLIWLALKLGAGYTSIRLVIAGYDKTSHDQGFKLSLQQFPQQRLTQIITVSSYNFSSLSGLKELNFEARKFADPSREKAIGPDLKIEPDIAPRYSLPYGESLRPILGTARVSASGLRRLLETKGVFVNGSNKNRMIPMLTSTFLSSSDIELLQDILKTKEDHTKIESRRAPLLQTVSLEDAVEVCYAGENEFSEVKVPTNCSFTSPPRVIAGEDGAVEIYFEINRIAATKDLFTGSTQHAASLTVRQVGKNLVIDCEYTSTETREICNAITTVYLYRLQESGILNKDDVEYITFGSFSNNSDRNGFMLSFLYPSKVSALSNPTINNVRVKPDDEADVMPGDLESMRGKVRILNLNGKTLEELPHFSNPRYLQALLMESLSYEAEFNFNNTEGICDVFLEFKSALNATVPDLSSVLSVRAEIPKRKENVFRDVDKTQLAKEITQHINDLAYAYFDARATETAS